MLCSTEFASVKRRVSPESTLFLYSDGITESTDEAGNEFDQNRLAETLLRSGNLLPSAVVETIQRTIVRYTNGAQPSDDRTMLALRWSRKEFEQCHITKSCSSAQEIPHVRSWPRQS
jgi:sigma-B regulation protein RsbU (phosphoserine phosphatase)